MGVEGTGDFDEAFGEGFGAGGVLAAEIEDSPVVGEFDPGDEFEEVGVEDGIVREEEKGGRFELFRFSDGEADGEGVAAFVFVSAWISTKAGVDGGEAGGGDADLIEVILQLGASVFPASEVDLVAQGEGFFEVHGGGA